MSDVMQVHGFGFAFAGRLIGIAPNQFLAFIDQTPWTKQKLQEKAPGFLDKIREMDDAGVEMAGDDSEFELNELLQDYEWDYTACYGLVSLYVDTVNEISGIGLDVQRDNEEGNIVMFVQTAPWEYTPKQLQIKSTEELSSTMEECSDRAGFFCDTTADFVTAEAWG